MTNTMTTSHKYYQHSKNRNYNSSPPLPDQLL